MKEMNVFLVDDDKLFIFLTKKTIKATEVITNIKEFGDGLEAISYLKEIAGNAELLPDLILLDLSMPVMDGWEFLEEYMQLQLEKKIKLYIFTSSISPHDVERARSIGVVSDFIVKPLDRDQIFQILK
jgi:CheY-like chemotaxis protein